MHIKRQANALAVYRNRYVPPEYVEVDGRRAIIAGTGRTRQDKVGSLPLDARSLDDSPSALLEALTTEERTELARWLESQEEERQRQQRAEAPTLAPQLMEVLAEALDREEVAMDESLSDRIWEAWEHLARHLRAQAYQQKTSRKRRGLDPD